MSERIEVFELIERLDAASRDETLSDGMLYRAAAERLAEYISRDVKYWHSIMQRTDKQAERIKKLEAAGITLVEANKELDEALEREIDKRLQLTKQVREAFVMFWKAQGCSCCEDTDASDKYGSRLAELLNIPLYDDGSGVDYYSVCKELEGSDE